MKRLALLVLAALVSAAAVSARDTEVSVSYGAMPAMKYIGSYHGHWHGVDSWGAVNATIDHQFVPNLWMGLGYTYSSGDSNRASHGRYGQVTWHGLTVNMRYEWLHRGPVVMYSHLGLGVLVEYYSPSWQDSYNRTQMAFQVSPLGLQYDLAGAVGAFIEAGYGVQGIIKAGLRVGF